MSHGRNEFTGKEKSNMKTNAHEGLGKVYWTVAIVITVLMVLATIFWWLDKYTLMG